MLYNSIIYISISSKYRHFTTLDVYTVYNRGSQLVCLGYHNFPWSLSFHEINKTRQGTKKSQRNIQRKNKDNVLKSENLKRLKIYLKERMKYVK